MRAETWIVARRPGDVNRAGRTARALAAGGVFTRDLVTLTAAELAARLAGRATPVWLVGAGTWPVREGGLELPESSDTGLSLAALGAVSSGPGPAGWVLTRGWAAGLAATGGVFGAGELPDLASVYLEAPAAVGARLLAGADLATALREEWAVGRLRLVHVPDLDVHDDLALRVVQLVTSFQRGGAERVALDLCVELARRCLRVLPVGLHRPGRAAFPVPPGAVDLSAHPGGLAGRLTALARGLRAWGADVVHAHLLSRAELASLAGGGWPVVVTVHNARPGWPAGLAEVTDDEVALLVGCSQRVEQELREAGSVVPTRTVWNGVDVGAFAPSADRSARGAAWRERLGFAADDVVLAAVANPRPQKRLALLPAVVASLREEFERLGVARACRLVLVGEAADRPDARRTVEAVDAEIARLGLAEQVRWAGAVEDVAGLLAGCDVLVSVSAHEGLSLAQLEALAAGRPVVTTDVGGAAEVAAPVPGVTLVPPDATPEQVAREVAAVVATPPPRVGEGLVRHFSRFRMAERYAWLYPAAVARAARRPGRGLWLVANNFSTGGAQSSARRLLVGLAGQGVRVRAAVLQEEPDHPTAGRRALIAAGVPVHALPPAGANDPVVTAAALLEQMALDPPEVVVFWNAITEHKVLLADALLGVRVFDVSPGEMYFSSLERFFQRPRPGLPYRTPPEYGARLAGVVVKYAAERDQAAALGVPVHVIPNGVPLLPPPGPRAAGPLVLGTLVRISPQKKLGDLFAALHRVKQDLPPWVLRIAGGVERGAEDHAAELRQQAADLPVEWLGGVDEPAGFLAGLDLFVLVAEPAGCPNASLEALAAGLPVVVTDVGGTAEQVRDGQTGRLVARGDVVALGRAVAELAGDPAGRARLGAAGRAWVAERFGVERMVAEYRRVLGV